MQVRELENQLGVKLFERRQHGAQLTDAGREILVRAKDILMAVRDLDDFARHHEKELSGKLRLGVIPSMAPYILPPLLPVLRGKYNELDLLIRESQTETLVEELIEGQLDVLLLALPIEHPEIVTEPLFEDRFLLASPADQHFSETEKRAGPELLESGRLLLLEEGHCLRDQALAVCQLRQIETRLGSFVIRISPGVSFWKDYGFKAFVRRRLRPF